ncbi:MAG: WXG100 family type VII secretion target [Sarcina sp.]
MARIGLTPDELIEGAGQVEGRLEEIMTTLQQLKNQVDGVCDNWEGAAQSSFVVNFNEIYAGITKNFPEIVNPIAAKMRAVGTDMAAVDNGHSNG